MPYYVFRLSADRKNLTLLNTCAKYPEAKEICRDLRIKQGPNETDLIRMAFAQNEKDARRPSSHVFEGMRSVLFEQRFRVDLLVNAMALNIVYLAGGIAAFLAFFNNARVRGQLLHVGE